MSKFIKIGVDARILTIKPKGVAKVFRNLLLEITRIEPDFFFYLFLNNEPYEHNKLHFDRYKVIRVSQIKGERLDSWMQIRLPYEMYKHKIDISFFPANKLSLLHPKPSIVIVHDTKLLRKLSKNLTNKFNRHLLLKALRRASIITTVSNYSKESMVHEFALSPEKVHVIYNGISNNFQIIKDNFAERETKAKFNLSTNYLFALGSPNPNKNTSILFDVIRILRKYGFNDLKLLISGIVEKEHVKYFRKQAENKGVDNQVVIVGYVSEKDLIKLYNFADIFLYPQTDEGFGLPPIEAMACGTPVIASNSSAIPEVVGDAAILVNPYNAEEIALQVIKLRKKLQDPSIKNEIIQKGLKHASYYSWSKAATRYSNLFRLLNNCNVPKPVRHNY